MNIRASDIQGVYCGINAFMPFLFSHFSSEDASYAALETQALWLALLASLNCRIVNPPALDTLAGTYLAPAEFLNFARNIGFQIPMVAYLESGKITAEIYEAGTPARYSDLGQPWAEELTHSQVNINTLIENQDHFMIQENPPGKPVWITIIGKRLMACELNDSGTIVKTHAEHLPKFIRSRLLKLNRSLNLHMAEYIFKILIDGTWLLCGVTHPPQISTTVYHDTIFNEIADYLLGLRE
jgi:hypothetical protein